MLVERKAVGHAGEVVGHDPRRRGSLSAGAPARHSLGRQSGSADEQLKQIVHDAAAPSAHPVDPIMPIHPLEQKLLERPVVLRRISAKKRRGRRRALRIVVGVVGAALGRARARVSPIRSHHASITRRIVSWIRRGSSSPRIARGDVARTPARPAARRRDRRRKQPGAQPVVDIVIVVGDVVGQRRDLRFGAGKVSSSSVMALVVLGDRRRHRPVGAGPAQRAIVLDQSLRASPRSG